MRSFLGCLVGTPNKRETFSGSSFVDTTFSVIWDFCLHVWLCYHTIYHLNRNYKCIKMMEEKKVTVSTNSAMHHGGEQGNKSIHFPINDLFGEGKSTRNLTGRDGLHGNSQKMRRPYQYNTWHNSNMQVTFSFLIGYIQNYTQLLQDDIPKLYFSTSV